MIVSQQPQLAVTTNHAVARNVQSQWLSANPSLADKYTRTFSPEDFRMQIRKSVVAGIFLVLAIAAVSYPAAAQATNCTSSQQAAVRCFVSNAVTTKLTTPRYGMTLAQFEAYGVAVNNILQVPNTYLMLVGASSAIADAMPPTNANGSANPEAQSHAVAEIVRAAVSNQMAKTSTGATLQDLEWFCLDVTDAMNENNGLMGMLTPGVSLRIIDSYIVTGTTNGTVNWTVVDNSLSTVVDNFISSGMMKVPPGISAVELKAFVDSLAHAIEDYKVATARKSL
jgi:hypothetical protein